MTHHLYVPKLYILHGAIHEIPEIAFSYYPMMLDLLYMVPLAWGNDIVPKYIHFSFALFTAWLIFDYLKTRLNQTWGTIGAVFFLSLPIIVKLSITVYVDLGLVAFSTASLLMLFKWAEKKRIQHLVFAGILCGLAVGTKYNGLIMIFVLTLFVPLLFSRSTVGAKQHSSFRAIGYGVIFLFCALLTFSPWMIKNYKWTGNPVYPLYNSVFQNFHSRDIGQISTDEEHAVTKTKNMVQQFTSQGSSVFAQRKVLYHETWWQAILLPIRFFFEGQDDNPRYFDGKLNPFLLFLPFFAFFFFRHSKQVKREQYFLFAFAWLYFFFAFFQGSLRIRYITPSLPAFVILSTYGLHNLSVRLQSFDSKRKHFSIIVLGCVLIPLFMYNIFYIVGQFDTIRPLSYITGKVSRDEFITQFRGEYPVQQYANTHLEKGDKILAIYVGRRGYYFDFPVIFDLNGTKSILGELVVSSETSDEIAQKLYTQGFSHLFIRFELFSKKANDNLSLEKITLINQFLTQNCQQLVANKEYGLFKLLKNNSNTLSPAPQ